ncbi:glycosyltransferase family A protein [Motilimonas sp. 1_MG-2023]|uniref:glycosyltransferase family 2 protein n=1 Tax=Motilimonas sp. 1_MG-2023 TaxID=3062672 RepID=UPI0026E1BF18|nr:glycosyltransferase family A protein [Motilimonas sp. 1_MG-2023]MDO6524772.1 glycosyltransferase family A protein [Motilimonas sp. 1_MG-2023]
MPPSLTIVIPTHNRPQLLPQAVESAIGSYASPSEILVIDDASEPAVNEVALQQRLGSQVKVHRNETSIGIYRVRQKGCELASGQYIYQLDDDDRLAAGSLDIAMAALRAHKLDLLYLNVTGFGERGDYFNRNQGVALERFMALAQPMELAPELDYLTNACSALLQLAPSALQHPLAKKQLWLEVNHVRNLAHQAAYDGRDTIDCAREARLLDELNDCEFALYASCLVKLGFHRARSYLARCEGQRYFSSGQSNHQQLEANLMLKKRFYGICCKLSSLKDVRKQAKSALAQVYFNAAWDALKQHGDKSAAFNYLLLSAQLVPQLKVFKFALTIFWSPKRRNKARFYG